jgi:ubiquinone biosynthesis protein COQ4
METAAMPADDSKPVKARRTPAVEAVSAPQPSKSKATAEDAQREYKGRTIRPLAALRAYGRLVKNKEDTVQVFEIMNALSGMATPNGYLKLTRKAGGVAFAREELADKFRDPKWLAQFAPGTVGAAYREFMARENLSVDALAQDNRSISPFIDAPHVYAWYGRRLRDVHDVWHVLTGYGRDALGEACIVSFSYAQTGNLGFGFIGAASAFRIRKGARHVPARRAVWEAWRNGRKARWLPALDYAKLFAEPLDQARERLGIRTPEVYYSVAENVREKLTFNG